MNGFIKYVSVALAIVVFVIGFWPLSAPKCGGWNDPFNTCGETHANR